MEEQEQSPLLTNILDNNDRKTEVNEEVKKQLWLAGPLVAFNLLQSCLQMVTFMYVGHLGKLSLSSTSVAVSFVSFTGYSLLTGLGSALETFCGQSYGAKQYHMLGIHLQRAMLILLLISIPLAVIWAFAGEILRALGQNHEISVAAGIYARWMIPCLFAYGLLQCQVRFLQAQNIVFPLVISSSVTALLHLLICWCLVFKSGLGNKGGALATSISYWINVILLALYVKFSPSCKKTWTGLSKAALRDTFHYLRLAIPSAVMVVLPYWAFELPIILAGFLPNPKVEISVVAISLNISSLIYMIPTGLSGAVSTRVSNELGAGHPLAAHLAVFVVVTMETIVGVIAGIAMISLRRVWGSAYSNDEEIVKYASKMMPILAVASLVDGLQNVLSGVVKGCGLQKIGAYINFGAHYIVGLPCSVVLAFILHLGGMGLWLGIFCGIFAQVVMYFAATLNANWEREAMKARERVHHSSIPQEMAS